MSTCLSDSFFVYLLHKNEFIYEENSNWMVKYLDRLHYSCGRFCVFYQSL